VSTFVLVHGSWQGGWIWDQVAGRLRNHGHAVLAPTLPGHHQLDEERADLGHDDLVEAVLVTLDDAGPDPVVLVGHSLAGAVISQVADRRPDRIARLVYCDAFVLRDGEAIADVLPAEFAAQLRALAQAGPDRSLRLPWELWRDRFMQTSDERTVRAAFDRLVPDPYRMTFDPVRLPRLAGLDIPATFVCFGHDRTMPAGFWHPGMSARLAGAPVVELDGDHEAPLTAPAPLAEALHQIATDPCRQRAWRVLGFGRKPDVAATIQEHLRSAGLRARTFALTDDAEGQARLVAELCAAHYDGVAIGGFLNGQDPAIRPTYETTLWFNRVLNLVHAHAPQAKIILVREPSDALPAIRRVLDGTG
jgi:pimeloyl-ACP methyl ester carboxylesterase